MFAYLLMTALMIIAASILISLYRVIRGPSMPDRIIAVDTIGINIIGMVAIISMMLETQAFLEIILLIGILAFIGTISYAKFLERGVVIERRRDQ
ncbi:multicomponent Na+:H+ antiporter subunit F [Caldalkalibacillus uzonensis]|uniref:Multicomponent Na+:H+ antiporter subunit F n=1 Tax=Caldalkalibacillus uzonensis TaxID=353224 RepID=A0ABU0CT38_9BACI|nr:Na(+)/H(+) antiporter subunit F1 [Caldalkalibacillus uzonensis]MDQ0339579.1 multicomponent Na+:H+ antiporter subunit F [Caldalkalibacillus uzonensis]